MADQEKNNHNSVVLQGRVYPAILKCIENRYRIILGIFAYYAFILSFNIVDDNMNFWIHILFSLLTLHNLYNYWSNSNEQKQLESALIIIEVEKEDIFTKSYTYKKMKSWSIETIFSIMILIFMWFGYFCIGPNH